MRGLTDPISRGGTNRSHNSPSAPATSDAASTASFDELTMAAVIREREVGDEDRHREADAAEQSRADDVMSSARPSGSAHTPAGHRQRRTSAMTPSGLPTSNPSAMPMLLAWPSSAMAC